MDFIENAMVIEDVSRSAGDSIEGEQIEGPAIIKSCSAECQTALDLIYRAKVL
jgi:hypothetical protein